MEGGQVEQRTAQPPLQVLPLVWDKSSLDDWKDSAAECVRGNIFAKQQFLVSDACLDMGGYIQRHVTNFINVSSVEIPIAVGTVPADFSSSNIT